MSFGSPYITLPRFQYLKPKTVDEALNLLNKHGEKAKILAGGIAVIDFMKERLLSPEYLIDIKGIDELKRVEFNGEKLRIGAAVTTSQLVEMSEVKEKYNLLYQALKTLDPILRNRSTLVGNICEAFPWMDGIPPCLVYDAELRVKSVEKERKIPINKFITGVAEVDLEPNELVTEIIIPKPPENHRCKYVKVLSKSEFSVLTIAASAANIERPAERIVRLAYGAAFPTPFLAGGLDEIFRKKEPIKELIREATEKICRENEPMEDVLATKEYRKHLLETLTMKTLKEILER